MSDVFEKLQQSINKNVKGAHASVLSQSNIATERTWIKTPALDLNRILSGDLYKGIQSRNLVGIVGPEHTMKSSFMVLCMAEAQKNGLKPVIIDTEGGITADFCTRWGLNPDEIFYTYTPWVHEVKSILGQIRATGDENFIIGVDSAGGLDRYKSLEDAQKGDVKADQGLLQKEIRGMLKLYLNICIAQNSTGIVCGHMYGKPSSLPMPDQIGGGKAMKLFPSILISLKKEKLLDSDKKVIGNKITATTLKNRLYPPFQTATVELDYINGINPTAGLVDLALEMGIIQKNGAWYSYKGHNIAQGAANVSKELNSGKYDEIFNQINEYLKTTGYSTINEDLKEAEKILEETGELPKEDPRSGLTADGKGVYSEEPKKEKKKVKSKIGK